MTPESSASCFINNPETFGSDALKTEGIKTERITGEHLNT